MGVGPSNGMRVSVGLMAVVSLLGLSLFAVDLAIGVSWRWYLSLGVLCVAVGVVATVASILCFVRFLRGEQPPQPLRLSHTLVAFLFILVLCLSWLLLGLKRFNEPGAVGGSSVPRGDRKSVPESIFRHGDYRAVARRASSQAPSSISSSNTCSRR